MIEGVLLRLGRCPSQLCATIHIHLEVCVCVCVCVPCLPRVEPVPILSRYSHIYFFAIASQSEAVLAHLLLKRNTVECRGVCETWESISRRVGLELESKS